MSSFGNYFEKVINGLVLELFFPQDLHSHKISLFRLLEDACFPFLNDILEKQRLPSIQEIYERISDDRHPI